MEPSLQMITVDTVDPLPLARWWSEALGAEVLAENDGWFVVLQLPAGGLRLAFQKVEEVSPGKNRLHLDFSVPQHQEEEVRRLVGLGAVHLGRHTMPDFSWDVLADPEGNQFCLVDH